MSISAPFIRRPIGTSLLAAALLLSGILAFNYLPVASLPRVDFPVISVGASLPGADPQTMASAVATPLERQFGRIAAVNQMTSSSQLGTTSIAMQFDLNRNIDAAARDVQASINAARSQLPANLAQQSDLPQDQPGGCADSDSCVDLGHADRAADVRRSRLHSVAEAGAGERSGPGVRVWSGAAGGARGSKSDPAEQTGRWTRYGAQRSLSARTRTSPKGQVSDGARSYVSATTINSSLRTSTGR
jgi:multidrug efflux pump